MRNLKLQFVKYDKKTIENVNFVLQNLNGIDNKVYLVSDSEIFVYWLDKNSLNKIYEVPDIVGAEYLALENEICIATVSGEVLVINENESEPREGTFCDVGIQKMAWSPDQEVLTLITGNGYVAVMTCTFDPISEHILCEQCSGEGQFVNVGWGNKETQFHGSAGKTAAKQRNDFVAPENVDQLPKNIEITWRGDGAYFAVSFLSNEYGRMFKVFDKEGNLNFISEKFNNLLPSIAWRPTGTWIAVPQQLPNKSIIALFEKNGLRHREIVLPFQINDEPILNLKWNSDSDILTIETENIEKNLNNLYLYTIGNYHWYLKQKLSFDISDKISTFSWDNSMGGEKTLHILLNSGKYLTYRWYWNVDKFANSGIVATIDGNNLLLTNFANAVIPPPMCAEKIQMNTPINACSILEGRMRGHNNLQLCIYDNEQKLHIFSLSTALLYQRRCTLAPQSDDFVNIPLELSNLRWIENDLILATTTINNSSQILLIKLDETTNTYRKVNVAILDTTINAISNNNKLLKEFYVHTVTGNIHRITIDDLKLIIRDVLTKLVQPADQIEVINKNNIVALKSNQTFYVDGQSIAEDVTSFCYTDKYLIYTKLTSLYFVRLNDLANICERKIERGGRLITTIEHASRTILQMPRGNIEAICPRVLTLDIIAEMLNSKKYSNALDILRKQRINLNIICDHNLLNFIENLEIFLIEIDNPNWLNLFINDLQNEDFTKTMYASNYDRIIAPYPEGFKVEEKINYICEKLCEIMEKKQPNHKYRLPIITAYVKMGKTDKALRLIWDEKKRESSDSHNDKKESENALKYLLYLVDVNELYNIALGTYDFGLVLFVAEKSQKDPKEYLPFLNELKQFEENYRKFKIDEYLKNFEKALENIALNGNEHFDEALAFIIKHELYSQALLCYESGIKECYQQICLAYADHLRSKGKLENASILYERGRDYVQALLSAKNILDWRRAIVLTQKAEGHTIESVARSLILPLEENGKYNIAFKLLKEYLNSFTEAIQSLCKGKLFLEAIFEARLQATDDNDLIATIILPEIQSYRTILESNLLADQDLFISYKQRLLDIRTNKAKQTDDNDFQFGQFDESDLVSETSSMHSSRYTASSRGTNKTFRSSKNRRKHARKLLSLKPGNAFEDIALIDALHNLITKIFKQQEHIKDICKALIELRQDNLASSIEIRFKNLQKMIINSFEEIWIPELMQATPQTLSGPNIDYVNLQKEQRYALLDAEKRLRPQFTLITWDDGIFH